MKTKLNTALVELTKDMDNVHAGDYSKATYAVGEANYYYQQGQSEVGSKVVISHILSELLGRNTAYNYKEEILLYAKGVLDRLVSIFGLRLNANRIYEEFGNLLGTRIGGLND